jgi:hypothetical protein
MQYMLQIFDSGTGPAYASMSDDERNAVFGEYMALSSTQGMLGGAQLQSADTATVVRVEDGRTLTTDGPFAESREVLGGYYLLEADDLDTALAIAARIPAARLGGAVEVRPVVQM